MHSENMAKMLVNVHQSPKYPLMRRNLGCAESKEGCGSA